MAFKLIKYLQSAVLLIFLIQTSGCAHQKRTLATADSADNPNARLSQLSNDQERASLLKRLKGFYDNASAEKIPAIAMIEGATKSIDIEIYEMGDKDFRAALRSALERKVKVRIVKDPTPLGADCQYFTEKRLVATAEQKADDADCLDQKTLVEEVNASGGQFVPFVKTELCDLDETDSALIKKSCYQHGKMIISDGKAALISTGNFNASNLCNLKELSSVCNRDYSFVTRDPHALKIFKKVFESDLAQKRYDIRAVLDNNGKPAKNITVSPLSVQPLVDFIRTAKQSIDIENQYLKHPAMNQALIDAAKKGVKVNVTVSSLCALFRPKDSARESTTKLFSAFDEAGISTRLFTRHVKVEGHPGYLHAKAIVVDGKKAWVGSVNGSVNALEMNREFGIFFSGKDVKKLKAILDYDHTNEATETWQESLDCVKD